MFEVCSRCGGTNGTSHRWCTTCQSAARRESRANVQRDVRQDGGQVVQATEAAEAPAEAALAGPDWFPAAWRRWRELGFSEPPDPSRWQREYSPRKARICTFEVRGISCNARHFGSLNWVCPDHGVAVDQADRPYDGAFPKLIA